jgi:hypothetical protein
LRSKQTSHPRCACPAIRDGCGRRAAGCGYVAFSAQLLELYRGLVAVGAESGQLGGVLARLADSSLSRAAAEIRDGDDYPALVTIVALAVIAAR